MRERRVLRRVNKRFRGLVGREKRSRDNIREKLKIR